MSSMSMLKTKTKTKRKPLQRNKVLVKNKTETQQKLNTPEDAKKYQMEMLQVTHRITKMESSADGFNSRGDRKKD